MGWVGLLKPVSRLRIPLLMEFWRGFHTAQATAFAVQGISNLAFSLTLLHSGWPATGLIPVAEHYQLIAGYAQITSRETEEKDDCGNVKQIVETINRDWDAYPYDIRAQTVQNVKRVVFINRADSKTTWDISNQNKGVTYSNLGPIRPGLTYEIVAARGTTIANTGPPYNYVTNNCDTFARRLYSDVSR